MHMKTVVERPMKLIPTSTTGLLKASLFGFFGVFALLMTGIGTPLLFQAKLDQLNARATTTATLVAVQVSQSVASKDRVGIIRSLRQADKLGAVESIQVRGIEPSGEPGSILFATGDSAALVDSSGRSRAWTLALGQPYAKSQPIVDNGETVGQLLVGLNSNAEQREIFVTIAGAIVVYVAMATLFTVVFLLIQRRLVAPLLRLEQHLSDLSVHPLSSAPGIPETGSREVQTVARTTNRLLSLIKAQSDQLLAANEELEERVVERTEQLEKAKNEAESANAAKTAFLATMTHEIRTPLNGVLATADLLTRSKLPQAEDQLARIIARSGRSLLAIINDILDLSKVEAGKMTIERIATPPKEILEQVLSTFGQSAREKKLELGGMCQPHVPMTIESDPVRLFQIISNLVSNALKFTDEGRIEISIDWDADFEASAEDDNDSECLVIRVSDTGVGISADMQDQIFEAFRQEDDTVTRKFGGTGLGLAIVKRIVDQMNGRIRLSSQPGQGSTFEIELPTRAIFDLSDTETMSARDVANLAPAVKGPVLLVSDKRTLDLEITEAVLEKHDVRSIRAESTVGLDETSFGLLVTHAADLTSVFETSEIAPETLTERLVVIAEPGDIYVQNVRDRGHTLKVIGSPLLESELLAALRLEPVRKSLSVDHVHRSDAERIEIENRDRKVMVVDDNDLNLDVMRSILGSFGVDARYVGSGTECLEIALRDDYDLIFLDISMPEMSGIEVCENLRSRESTAKIVALTAYTDDPLGCNWSDYGFDAHLTKPTTLEDIANVFRSIDGSSDHMSNQAPEIASVNLLNWDYVEAFTRLIPDSARNAKQRELVDDFAKDAGGMIESVTDLERHDDAKIWLNQVRALSELGENFGAKRLAMVANDIAHRTVRGNTDPLGDGRGEMLFKTLTGTLEQMQFQLDSADRAARMSDVSNA
ncbi:MAG: ATP-binding protein [Pseudomonadota bacterium]